MGNDSFAGGDDGFRGTALAGLLGRCFGEDFLFMLVIRAAGGSQGMVYVGRGRRWRGFAAGMTRRTAVRRPGRAW
jgi:hypothetical protein